MDPRNIHIIDHSTGIVDELGSPVIVEDVYYTFEEDDEQNSESV